MPVRNQIIYSCNKPRRYTFTVTNSLFNMKVYCKDCIFCKVEKAQFNFQEDKYVCNKKEGLSLCPVIASMDFLFERSDEE